MISRPLTLLIFQAVGLQFPARTPELAAVIPKSSKELHPQLIREWKQMGFPIRDEIGRHELESPSFATSFLRNSLRGAEEFLIVDHSGYFAPSLSAIDSDLDLNRRCLGLVDSTRSGTNAYAKSEAPKHFPFLNLYSSSIKDIEGGYIAKDFLIGLTTTLNEIQLEKSKIKTVGVIGLGKTGMPVFLGLRKIFGEQVKIVGYDRNSTTTNRDQVISESDLIISSTGESAIRDTDFGKMKDGVLIAVMTGANEELDLDRRVVDGTLVQAHSHEQLSSRIVGGTRIRYSTTYRVASRSINLLLGYPLNYLLENQSHEISMIHGLKVYAAARLSRLSRSIDLPYVGRNQADDEHDVQEEYRKILNVSAHKSCAEAIAP